MMEPDRLHVRLAPIADWRRFKPEIVQAWAFMRGSYGIATLEMVEWLKEQIGGRSAIEIGAGHGDFAYHLGIPATDSYAQTREDVREAYAGGGQPVIAYPATTEKLSAAEAIAKYQPQVVIASWVTQLFVPGVDVIGKAQAFVYGVDELALWENPCVETYIHIGNTDSHGKKRLRRRAHDVLQPPGLLSRSGAPQKNRVFIWNK